jgi:hypothetical protein
MKKWQIFRNWLLALSVIASVGCLFGYFVGWQWGLGIALVLLFALSVLMVLFLGALIYFSFWRY